MAEHPCAQRHRCHVCGYLARVRQGPGLESMLFKHKRQTNCDNVMIEQPQEASR